METMILKAVQRDMAVPAKKLRGQGFLPAELYGKGKENLHLSVSTNEFEKLFRKAGESTIISLEIEGLGQKAVLVQDVQVNFLKSNPDHIDFYEVDMSVKLTATVPLEFVGESIAIKALGGTLVKVLSEIEVECLPKDLPHSLEVDISSLSTFDDVVALSNISLPAGVIATQDSEEVVAKVQAPRDVEAELAEPIEEDVSKVAGAAEEKPSEDKAGSEKAGE